MIELQKERELQGMSRSALARKAEMCAGTVSQIESGYIGRPYPSQLVKLARALDYQGDPAALLEVVDDNASR